MFRVRFSSAHLKVDFAPLFFDSVVTRDEKIEAMVFRSDKQKRWISIHCHNIRMANCTSEARDFDLLEVFVELRD